MRTGFFVVLYHSDNKMCAQKTERRAIFITHFVNPNCFYFKFCDEQFNEQLKLFEDNLAEHAWQRIRYNSNSNVNRFEPKQHNIIAVYNISWSKWVRAIVKNVTEYPDVPDGKQYVLWAIDHGNYVKTFDKNSLVSLPIELRNCKIANVYQGSIYGYRPAVPELNRETLNEERLPTKDWSPIAMRTCQELIDTSATVYFDVISIHCGYRFGALIFKMANTRRLTILEKCLSELGLIILSGFNEEIIANKYSQTDICTSNENHIVKPTSKSMGRVVGICRKNHTNQPRHMQKEQENRDAHERSQNQNAPPMSVLQSEIDGGITRIRMNKRL